MDFDELFASVIGDIFMAVEGDAKGMGSVAAFLAGSAVGREPFA